MTSEVVVTFNGATHPVPRGTRVRELLKSVDGSGKPIAARLNGKLVDLSREIDSDSKLELVTAESPEGVDVLRHSTAHLMAQAVQSLYPGTQVTIGPTIEDGFYYDFAPPRPFTTEDLPKIEAKMRELVKADLKVERLEVPRDEAVRMFDGMGEKYKVEIIQGIPDERVSIYRQGEWMDLCRGPHVPSTRYLKAFKLTSVAGAYWRGDEHNAMLSRIYGTAFPNKEALEEHLKLLELARSRDHRKIGREMGLFFLDPVAPGSPFFLPKGAMLYNELVNYIRRLYRRYGFDEVISPLIYKNDLWHRSGHWEHFRSDMFLTTDGESKSGELEYAVKPMNCPGHCVMYRLEKRSYRDLPLRFADFSRLHRAEPSGTLHGLTRVRSFSQDDAHIFCPEDQIGEEIDRNLKMVRDVYQALGFDRVEYTVATMPDSHMGSEEMWRKNEGILAEAIRRNGSDFEIEEKGGTFYGPKISLFVSDALKRKWQVATIQLDYNMPERFELKFTTAAGTDARPVMIHRAILGSIERFIGVLLEHTGGVLPFWLAPEQVRVLSLSEKVESYAAELAEKVKQEGFRATADLRNEKLGFKVREAELAKVPYIAVVGEREAADRAVSVRILRGQKNEGKSVDEFIATLKAEVVPG